MPKNHPRSVSLCHQLIDRLESECSAMSEALHNSSRECGEILSAKDKQMEDKCRMCMRGLH